jgi:hypothetical protein
LLRQQREELMTLHRTVAATTRAAGLSLAFALGAAVTAEAQTTDPHVADLVRAGKVRVGLFLPQYGKGPDGLRTTVWVETARAYAARVGVPLVIVEHATPPEAIACAVAPGFVRTELTQLGRGAADWPGTEQRFAQRAMMGRIGEPEDIANAVERRGGGHSRFGLGRGRGTARR